MIHALNRCHVFTDGLSDACQVESEVYKQVNDVHLVTGEWISDLGTGPITLRPRTVIEAVVITLVLVVLDVMDVVQVEEDGRASFPT